MRYSLKKRLLAVAVVLAGAAASLAADPADSADASPPAPPQVFLNLAGIGGVMTEPIAFNGHGIGGAEAGLEYVPEFTPSLGIDLDYDYLVVGKTTEDRDNDLDLSLKLIGSGWGPLSFWMQGGVGSNLTANPINGHWLCFAEPGLRVVILPRLAFDAGVRYIVTSPSASYVQAWTGTVGLTIPLDGDYPGVCAVPSAKPDM